MDVSALLAQLDTLRKAKAEQQRIVKLHSDMRIASAKKAHKGSGPVVPNFPPVPTHPIIINKGAIYPIHEDVAVVHSVAARAAPAPAFNIFSGMRKSVITSGEKLLRALGRRETLPEAQVGKLNGTIKRLQTLSESELVRRTANAPRMKDLAHALTIQKTRITHRGGLRRLRKKGHGRKTRSRK